MFLCVFVFCLSPIYCVWLWVFGDVFWITWHLVFLLHNYLCCVVISHQSTTVLLGYFIWGITLDQCSLAYYIINAATSMLFVIGLGIIYMAFVLLHPIERSPTWPTHGLYSVLDQPYGICLVFVCYFLLFMYF